MDWSARQYVRFEDERTRPARNLRDAIPTTVARQVADLGCGPGNSMQLLAERWPGAALTGVDNSPDMIEQAKKRLPAANFVATAMDTWTPAEPQDVIFANASLQWLPDHKAQLVRLAGLLSEGGSLAVQMPDNLQEPCHIAMREVALQPRWAEKLKPAVAAREALGTAPVYYDLLKPQCAHVDVWRTVYNHPLDGAAGIVEWFKGSALRPFLARLDEAESADFLKAYLALIERAYPAQRDGKVLLPFPRLFIIAVR